jgi:hypothetical protein
MDFFTTTTALCGQLDEISSEQQPLVRAAMRLAIQPWFDGSHTDQDLFYWGEFATEVQEVEASWWTDPPQHLLVADTASVGSDTAAAAAALAEAVAAVFDRAADRSSGTLAWQRAASATQLRDAAQGLRDSQGSASEGAP